jgi:hypothetical protein
MDSPITEDNLIDEMRTAFPELEDTYQQIVEKWGDDLPGRYTIVGETLAASVRRELSAGEITEFLRRSAMFMERVSVSGDDEAINIIWIKIFEWLIFQPKELKLVWSILGSATKAHIRDAAHRWTEAGKHFGSMDGLPEANIPD